MSANFEPIRSTKNGRKSRDSKRSSESRKIAIERRNIRREKGSR